MHERRRRVRNPGVPAAMALAALACVAPLPAGAQEAMAPARLEAALGATSLHGDASAQAAASLLVGVSRRFLVGGTGSLVLGTRTLPGSVPGSDLELRTAFGGLVGQFALADGGRHELWLRLTLGAGNAKLDLAVVGTRIAADNFGVVVPEIGGGLRVTDAVHLGAALGYRGTFGVEDLPGVSPSDLGGPSARVLLSLRRF